MKTEFEIVFTNIDRELIIKNIINIGGIQTKKNTLMKRVVFNNHIKKDSYVRIRDEGGKITCTYKEIESGKLDINSVKELETEIQDFDCMVGIFENLGLKKKAFQENYREVWSINSEIEIMIDLWPGLNPYIEIEGNSEELVKKYTKLLGFNYDNGLFGSVDQIYKKELNLEPDYINNLEIITFNNPPIK